MTNNLRKRALIMSEWEHTLQSTEKLDRSSPELWPEAIPGVTEYAARNALNNHNVPKEIKDIETFDDEDYRLLQYYRSVSKEQLMYEIRKLHDLTYQLGLKESKEMTRGRFIAILPSKTSKSKHK